MFLPQAAPVEKKETGQQPMFMISVEDPQRVGDPIRAYIMYTVHTKASCLEFGSMSAVLSLLPDDFSDIFQVFVFCSSPLFGLSLAV